MYSVSPLHLACFSYVFLCFVLDHSFCGIFTTATTLNTSSFLQHNSTNTTPASENQTSILTASMVISTVIITSIGILSNTLLILVIILNPLKNLHKGAWMTIFSLAISDALASFGTAFFYLLHYLLPENGYGPGARAANVFYSSGQTASFMCLTFLTVEVYLVTKYPLKRYAMCTKRKVICGLLAIWVFSFAITIPAMLNRILFDLNHRQMNVYNIVCIGFLEAAVLVQAIFKVLILLEIAKSSNIVNNASSAQRRHIAKTVLILNLVLFVTAFPYFVGKQLEFLMRIGAIGYNHTLYLFPYRYLAVASINYIVNPFFYGWRIPEYRRTFMHYFKSKNQRKPNTFRLRSNCPSNTARTSLAQPHEAELNGPDCDYNDNSK